ncbi:WD40-repeat-containing domain protein [Aspergillus egyptiacus]|nr:WD40-repeat-containing domain protein [Aspergillus egyptiacus]
MTTPAKPPATPTYILRGHAAPIHALQIFHNNLRLVSGDADGWIVVWDLVFKRPVAVWKAHEGAVLEVKGFTVGTSKDQTEIYTHGRDHKLRVWRFRAQDEEILQRTLPVDVDERVSNAQSKDQSGSQPWLVHSLPVNALNFCAFSMLVLPPDLNGRQDGSAEDRHGETPPPSSALIAVPNALDSGAIDLFNLPRERRICTIPTDPSVKTGMVMAANLINSPTGDIYVAAAYEDGHVMVFRCRGVLSNKTLSDIDTSANWKWTKLYTSRPHTQPVLSIDVSPSREYFLSSSADAVLAKHPMPGLGGSKGPTDAPLKSINTKHAGQQGVRIRDDGKIFATAGWDCRVRVYSCKTMKELAVLKWHKEGCYAVAFASVVTTPTVAEGVTGVEAEADTEPQSRQEENEESAVVQREKSNSLAQVQHQRNLKVANTHWLAAGSKDGKISLWDIY